MKNFWRKSGKIVLESLPVFAMIVLIPLVKNDYFLSTLDILIITICLSMRRKNHDLLFLAIGFLVMTISETIFVSTGVEIFTRKTLLGIMPVWLPILWSYSFVVMKRSVKIIEM